MTAGSRAAKDMNAGWHVVCEWASLATVASREFVIEGIGDKDKGADALEGFIVRQDQTIFAYQNSCPHQRVNLNWNPDQFLSADEQFIECGMHGALFSIDDGVCVHGPCVNQRLQALPVKVLDGQVCVQVV